MQYEEPSNFIARHFKLLREYVKAVADLSDGYVICHDDNLQYWKVLLMHMKVCLNKSYYCTYKEKHYLWMTVFHIFLKNVLNCSRDKTSLQ